MSNLVIIPDVHGKTIWKNIMDKEGDAEYIFLGDYFDSYREFVPQDELNNFNDIMALGDNVTHLIGNHDFHYSSTQDSYSGHLLKTFELLGHGERIDALIESLGLPLCTVRKRGEKTFLFSHAGISPEWLKSVGILKEWGSINEMVFDINQTFSEKPSIVEFSAGYANYTGPDQHVSNSGDNVWQSPIWIRPSSLNMSYVENVIHVFGHTKVKEIASFYLTPEETAGFILTDVLDTRNQYTVINEEGEVFLKVL